jgi:hypothetical protein
VEKESDCLFALAPKVYYFYDFDHSNEVNEKQYKVKGVCKKQNPLTPNDYLNVLKDRKILEGKIQTYNFIKD